MAAWLGWLVERRAALMVGHWAIAKAEMSEYWAAKWVALLDL
jgi:hypothetical protein